MPEKTLIVVIADGDNGAEDRITEIARKSLCAAAAKDEGLTETARLHSVADRHKDLADFLSWLCSVKEWTLCDYVPTHNADRIPGGYYPAGWTYEELLSEYFGVDLVGRREEIATILARVREVQPVD